MRYQSGTGALFVTDVGATGGATSIGTFQATANGTGYSNGDIIVALSDGTWRNATTGATIAAPNPADLGTFGGAVDFEIILWRATAVNAGLGYAVGNYLYEVFNTTTGGTSWYRNGAALGGIPPEAEREIPGGGGATSLDFEYNDYTVTTAHNGLTVGQEVRERITSTGVTWTDLDGGALAGTPDRANLQRIGGSSSQASTTATPYQIDGTGPVLYGTLSADRTQIESIPPGTTTTIGTGAGEAQLTGSSAGSSFIFREYTATLTSAALESAAFTLNEPQSLAMQSIMTGYSGGDAHTVRLFVSPQSAPTAAQYSEFSGEFLQPFLGDGTLFGSIGDDLGFDAIQTVQVRADSLPVGASVAVLLRVKEVV